MSGDPAWVTRFGGVVERVDDSHSVAVDRFAALLRLRKAALPSWTKWQVRRDTDFEIQGGSIPNAGLIGGDVWLTLSGQRILRGGAIDRLDLSAYFAGTEYRPTEASWSCDKSTSHPVGHSTHE